MLRASKIFLIAILTICTLMDKLDPDYSYSDFQKQYNRNYQGAERTAHENASIGQMTKKVVQISLFLAYLNYEPQKLDIPPSSRPPKSDRLFASPNSFDWRTLNKVSSVKNQGSCGSSWAFSAIAEYESKLAIAANTYANNYDLAEQYVFQCSTNSSRCNGGFSYRSLQLIKNTGVPLESAYPYNPSKNYSGICTNSTGRVKLNKTVSAVNLYYFQNLTAEQLQQDLMNYGPINVGVYGKDNSFLNAGPTGLITCTPTNLVNLAVLLIGYNTTHWFIKNSWGSNWGDGGYGYISKNQPNDCNIRQYITEMQVDFGQNPAPPDQNAIPMIISMNDSYGDGWNGNTINIVQDYGVVGTFGESFTSGFISPPITFSVQRNLKVVISVNQFKNKTKEIGFTIKFGNGTIIYQRLNGIEAYNSDTIFTTFCPGGNCADTLILSIYMNDSYGDGWNGNILAIRQYNMTVGVFGAGFTSGFVSGPSYITVQGRASVDIVVSKLGNKSKQVGFLIKAPNSTVIHQRQAGTAFDINTTFSSFCPNGNCIGSLQLMITMTDSFGDGWNGNILGVKQNNTIVGTFGGNFITGSSSGPVFISVLASLQVQIVGITVSGWPEQCGFMVKAPNGTILAQRLPGFPFPSGMIFSIFCPIYGCPSTNYTNISVTMTDSFGDGWGGNFFVLRQNSTILGYFGNIFTTGYSSGPIFMIIDSGLNTQVLAVGAFAKKDQVGYLIQAKDSTIVSQRVPGSTFNSNVVLDTFCLRVLIKNPLTLNITLNSSYGDGWNGNILAIKQNNQIMGTFGANFYNGYSYGPISMVIETNTRAYVVVSTLGSYSYRVGFVIRDANGTILLQRYWSSFDMNTDLGSFYPSDVCTSIIIPRFVLTIIMTDQGSDGWNGNILALYQNGVTISTFGVEFKSGNSFGPFYISIPDKIETQIIVYTLGNNTNEIGFTIKSPNGTTIFQRNNGSTYSGATIFTTFCPGGGCPENSLVTFGLTLTDSYGDGWEGTTLVFQQNGRMNLTFTLSTGSSAIYFVTLSKFQNILIKVYALGYSTNQIGFVLETTGGVVYFQRIPGSKFFADSLIGSFCFLCSNLKPTLILPEGITNQLTKLHPPTQPSIDIKFYRERQKSYIIAITILASLGLISLSICLIKIKKLSKEISLHKQNLNERLEQKNQDQIINSASSDTSKGEMVEKI